MPLQKSMEENDRNSLVAALEELPHGANFRFVDRLVSLVPGKEAEGVYLVKGTEAFLEGHFPGNPIMPGVVMVEAMAQLAGVVAQTDPEVAKMADVRLAAVRGAKVNGTFVPGEEMRIVVRVDGRMGNLVQASGEVLRGGEVVVSGKVTLSGS